jgi:hypothetical protein
MSGYAVVDVAIGLSFAFLILSVFATSIVEAVAGLLSYRAKSLEDWLAQNLTDDVEAPPAGLGARIGYDAKNAAVSVIDAVKGKEPTQEQKAAKHILGHPVVYAMTKGASRPSYVPRDRFVSALLGRGGETRAKVFAALGSGDNASATTGAVIKALPAGEVRKGLAEAWSKAGGDVETFRSLAEEWYAGAPAVAARAKALIDDLPDGPMKRAMRTLWIEADKNAKTFRNDAETWFDQAMQRLSGSYKRRTQVWLWIVGFAFAVLLDVDAIRIANALWQDQTLRQVVADQAQLAPSSGIDPKGAADTLSTLGLPLGWDGWPSGFTNWFSTAVGLVVTSAAVSLGAPFWFDSLSKLANLRNAGPKPKSAEDASP